LQLRNVSKRRVQAVHLVSSPLTIMHRDAIMRALVPQLPVIVEQKELTEKGALLSYSVNFFEQWRRGATYIHKILKGAKAGDLPIEQPTRFELVVNLRSAKALGIKIPESVLAAADEVIR